MRKMRAAIGVLLVLIVVTSACSESASDSAGFQGGPGMLYFYSPECPVCQGMKPIVDRLEETYGDKFNIVRIDVTKPSGEKVAREVGIVGQPNYVFFDSANEETRRMAGPQTYEVMAQEIELTLQK